MGPLHRLSSFFSASVVDVNNNRMGVKGKKKNKFASDIDIFGGEGIKTKTYIWATLRTPKKNKGNFRS
ncbi:unnamed protein product [Phaedon cochleariae]|uniref:Uncharacterized protein n=1 Tax=Phaedon cochleariae TaxID=80249 RepID=A0A9N9SGU4_PHACE|nr:unnamed protein product [Phaedon cochleariae]